MQIHRINFLTSIWNRPYLLTLAIGTLLGLSFPPFPFPFLQIPALLLLYRLAEITSGKRQAVFYSTIAFVIWNTITTYWMTFATLAGGIAAILANSLVMAVPFLILRHALRSSRSFGIKAVVVTAAWLSFEFLHHHWDLAWPWLTLGNGWSNAVAIIQYVSVTGILGVSAWMLLSTIFLYEWLTSPSSTGWNKGIIAVLILAAPPLVSLGDWAGNSYPQNGNRSRVEVGIVQPDFDSYQQLSGYDNAMEPLQLLLGMSDSLRSDQTELIVWPENAIESFIPSHLNSRLAQTVMDSVNQWRVPILSGGTYLREFEKDDHPPLVRRRNNGTPYLYYNSGMLFKPGRSFEVYNKNKLVPMVERIPFLDVLHYIPLPYTSWNELPWLAKGRQSNALNLSDTLSTSALVCYDSIFSDWIGKMVRNSGNVGFLTIITNDGWWGNTSGHVQHFSYARPRAIAFDRWIVRSANNGISGIIAPDGSVKRETEFRTRTAFEYPVPIRQTKTLIARTGNWPGYVSVFVTFLYLMGLLINRGKRYFKAK